MNYKKGLWRFFIVSSIAVFFFGYFVGANTANSAYMSEYDFYRRAVAELNKPVCQEAIKNNPTKFPEWTSNSPNPCLGLALKYDFAKSLHDKEKRVGQVSELDLMDNFEDTWGNYRVRSGAFNGWIVVSGYWVLLVVSAIAFFILRWVYRGFKK